MKCIHIDMDCFYAAIEERENPSLKGQPVAVGGTSPRSVLCTANYQAREFGCRSAMPAYKAKELCPNLVILPVRMDLYKKVSSEIRSIFKIFTELIEPLSLDEAYLDVSSAVSSSSAIAEEIRYLIHQRTSLTASAGIAPNKMLAKIASDWNKPNGQYEIQTDEIDAFMRELPVKNIWGVGKQSLKRLNAMGFHTCKDVQTYSKIDLYQSLGNFGILLFDLCRGIDEREVKPKRLSKSISKETTFSENITNLAHLLESLPPLLKRIESSLQHSKVNQLGIKTNVIKLKFHDFSQTTVEKQSSAINRELIKKLVIEAWKRGNGKAVRLLGVGVKFHPQSEDPELNFHEVN